jgi:hypothetical protein
MLKLKPSPTGRRHGAAAGRGQKTAAPPLSAAEAILQRAVRLHRDWNVGTAGEAELEESCRLLARLTAAHPDRIALSVVRGLQLRHLGRYAESERVLAAACAADPADPEAKLEHAHALLLLGRHAEGFAKYECRIENPAAYGRDNPEFPGIPRWNGEPVGRLLLNGTTDGRGDAIWAVRWAFEAAARCGEAVLVTYPELERLLAPLAVFDVIPYDLGLRPHADAQVSLLSLPHILGAEWNAGWDPPDMPYLTADDPAAIARWRPAVEQIPGFRVGICWQGNSSFAMDKLRSIPLEHFRPLAAVPDVRLVSLQHGPDADSQIASAGLPVWNLGPAFQDGDFLDTAAIASQLDLVIAPDTAVAHLAGALGKPVWVLNATPPDWRWAGTGDTSPWYRSARVFRQADRRDWGAVFESVALALASVVR